MRPYEWPSFGGTQIGALQSAVVALVTQRRSLRAQLVKLLGSDEAAQAAAQDEARRLNVSSASLEALSAAVERAAKERERRQAA